MSLRSFSHLSILSKHHPTSSIAIRTVTLTRASSLSRRTLNTSSSKMATNKTSEAGLAISEMSKQEGGSHKGSTAARMQSQITKQHNLGRILDHLGAKASDDASLLKSAEARANGGLTKRDLSSQAESVAAAKEQGATVQTNANADLTPAEQSQLHREANFVEAADEVGTKLATEPENVTKDDGDLLHSRETRAFGATEKGGIASQAQSQAAKNAGDTA